MKNIVQKKYDKKFNFKKWWSLQKNKDLLRFLTCGSVDDGKSTLIGRLLYDSKEVYNDQLSLLKQDSKNYDKKQKIIDLSLLVDGLQSEREQGITIDVAYRYFSTNKKKFIIADSPGHKQYTRNMATGASNSDVSILLIDAKKGLTNQTYRHSLISSMLGIKYFIIAINKMDLVNFQEDVFLKIKKNFLNFYKKLPTIPKIYFIPICALLGDNIVISSINMLWYRGKTLLHTLEDIDISIEYNKNNVIFPIQYVNHFNQKYRLYSGTLLSGTLFVGQKIKTLPMQSTAIILKIITCNNELKMIDKSLPLTLMLENNIDLSRGDIITNQISNLILSKYAILDVIWMSENPLLLGQKYKIKLSGKHNKVIIQDIKYELNPDNLKKYKTDKLLLNSIGVIKILFEEPIVLTTYNINTYLGGIIFIDILSNMTVGAGMIRKYNYDIILNKKDNFQLFESELNKLICKFFPHWKTKNIN